MEGEERMVEHSILMVLRRWATGLRRVLARGMRCARSDGVAMGCGAMRKAI